MADRWSFDLKLDRAEKHLADLKDAVDAYADTHPYTIRSGREGKRNVHRLHFTVQPDPMIGLVAADLIYNLRSGLDHLAAALVPSHDRDSVMFPIFFQGVWEPAIEGENAERTKARARWDTCTRRMAAEAVAIIKAQQPTDESLNDPETIWGLVAINRLSNTDRHSKLPVLGYGLADPLGIYTLPDGRTMKGWSDEWPPFTALKDDAEVGGFPDDAMDVKIQGTPMVAVGITGPNNFLRIPDTLDRYCQQTRTLVGMLHPYARGKPR